VPKGSVAGVQGQFINTREGMRSGKRKTRRVRTKKKKLYPKTLGNSICRVKDEGQRRRGLADPSKNGGLTGVDILSEGPRKRKPQEKALQREKERAVAHVIRRKSDVVWGASGSKVKARSAQSGAKKTVLLMKNSKEMGEGHPNRANGDVTGERPPLGWKKSPMSFTHLLLKSYSGRTPSLKGNRQPRGSGKKKHNDGGVKLQSLAKFLGK